MGTLLLTAANRSTPTPAPVLEGIQYRKQCSYIIFRGLSPFDFGISTCVYRELILHRCYLAVKISYQSTVFFEEYECY